MRRLVSGLRSAVVALAVSGCVATTVAARDVNLRSDNDRVVTQPAKAQLLDGSIVIFRDGFRNEGGQLRGTGWRYDPTLRDSVKVSAVPVDSIAGVVAFQTGYDPAKSLGMTAAASVTLVLVLGIVYVAGCYATRCLR